MAENTINFRTGEKLKQEDDLVLVMECYFEPNAENTSSKKKMALVEKSKRVVNSKAIQKRKVIPEKMKLLANQDIVKEEKMMVDQSTMTDGVPVDFLLTQEESVPCTGAYMRESRGLSEDH